MQAFFLFLMISISFFNFCFADEEKDPRTHYVVVSIAPYKYFVDAIAGDTVKVGLFVPPDVSFHNYEPTPKQVLDTANADIWFRIGESFEARAIQAFESHHPRLKIVDLRKNVDLITVGHTHDHGDEDLHSCCHANGADLHIWLSARQVKIQAVAIAQALIEMYPEHKQVYQQRLDKVLQDLDTLDLEVASLLKPLQNRMIMVAHPSYAYFARDYQLEQLPIEFEGKDPSPKQLGKILDQARAAHIKTIFVQRQYGAKGASIIAKELGANIVELNPYSGDYFVTMRNIAQRIAAQEQRSVESKR